MKYNREVKLDVYGKRQTPAKIKLVSAVSDVCYDIIPRFNNNAKIINIPIPQILCNYVEMCITNKHNIIRMSTCRKQTSGLFTKRENKWAEDLI